MGSAQDLYVSGVRFIPLDAQRVLFPVVSILAGALIIIVSVRARDTIMLADAHGIRKRWLLGNTFIP